MRVVALPQTIGNAQLRKMAFTSKVVDLTQIICF